MIGSVTGVSSRGSHAARGVGRALLTARVCVCITPSCRWHGARRPRRRWRLPCRRSDGGSWRRQRWRPSKRAWPAAHRQAPGAWGRGLLPTGHIAALGSGCEWSNGRMRQTSLAIRFHIGYQYQISDVPCYECDISRMDSPTKQAQHPGQDEPFPARKETALRPVVCRPSPNVMHTAGTTSLACSLSGPSRLVCGLATWTGTLSVWVA